MELNRKLYDYITALYEFTEGSDLQLIVGKLKDDLRLMNTNDSIEDTEFIVGIKN